MQRSCLGHVAQCSEEKSELAELCSYCSQCVHTIHRAFKPETLLLNMQKLSAKLPYKFGWQTSRRFPGALSSRSYRETLNSKSLLEKGAHFVPNLSAKKNPLDNDERPNLGASTTL